MTIYFLESIKGTDFLNGFKNKVLDFLSSSPQPRACLAVRSNFETNPFTIILKIGRVMNSINNLLFLLFKEPINK